MPPIVLVVVQGAFLLVLYLFVARVARSIVRDLRASSPAAAPYAPPRATAPPPRPTAPTDRPAGRSAPRELVVHLTAGRPQILPLRGEISFGRADGATVPLDDPYVSEQHARVYRDGDRWMVADLGSTNGTYLNKAKVTGPTPLQPGDQLGIGKIAVEVRR